MEANCFKGEVLLESILQNLANKLAGSVIGILGQHDGNGILENIRSMFRLIFGSRPDIPPGQMLCRQPVTSYSNSAPKASRNTILTNSASGSGPGVNRVNPQWGPVSYSHSLAEILQSGPFR